MATTSVTIRMDENLKKQVETLFDDMGLNMTTAITMFAKAVVRQNKIPLKSLLTRFIARLIKLICGRRLLTWKQGRVRFTN